MKRVESAGCVKDTSDGARADQDVRRVWMTEDSRKTGIGRAQDLKPVQDEQAVGLEKFITD